MTTVEGTGAARRPNPEFLAHAATFGRATALPEMGAPPALVQAQKQADSKCDAVIKAVNARARLLAKKSSP